MKSLRDEIRLSAGVDGFHFICVGRLHPNLFGFHRALHDFIKYSFAIEICIRHDKKRFSPSRKRYSPFPLHISAFLMYNIDVYVRISHIKRKGDVLWKNSFLTKSCPRKSGESWTQRGGAVGAASIPSRKSRKTARPTTEERHRIGSANCRQSLCLLLYAFLFAWRG